MTWACALDACDEGFEDIEDLLVHQARDHDPIVCEICGESMPDGYPALRHIMIDHTRAEYVRAYGASGDQIRIREEIIEYIEANADLGAVSNRLSGH